jgi:surface antigen
VKTYSHSKIWAYFRQHRVASIVTGHIIVACVFALVMVGSLNSNLFDAFAQTPCSAGDQTYVVSGGDTLSAIATRYGTTWQNLASYNKLANPDRIYIAQHICVPGKGKSTATKVNFGVNVAKGLSNLFPYGQCTWYANHRYKQLHGIYVPWTINSNAWQWTARARDFGWRVTGTPAAGTIIVLAPWVQGAGGLGHVGVVERVLSNGQVVASHMNWGAYPWQITYSQFSAGPGVSFVYA